MAELKAAAESERPAGISEVNVTQVPPSAAGFRGSGLAGIPSFRCFRVYDQLLRGMDALMVRNETVEAAVAAQLRPPR